MIISLAKRNSSSSELLLENNSNKYLEFLSKTRCTMIQNHEKLVAVVSMKEILTNHVV